MTAKRLLGIIFRPNAEWDAISLEPATVGGLLFRYILPLSLLPSVAIAVGVMFFGAGWDPVHGYALPGDRALAAGATSFVFVIATIFVLALIFHWLARLGNAARGTFANALKVATYGAIPLLLSGAFLVLPVMVMLGLVACTYSLFLCNLGLQKVLQVSSSEAPMLLGVATVLLGVASMAIGAIAAAMGLI